MTDLTLYVAISIGAVLGANTRFLVGGWVADRLGAAFPYGTLLINVSGSFLIGVVLTLVTERAIGPSWVRPALAIGFLGSYTTFSTFSYETLQLVESGSFVAAGANIAISVVAALIGVYLGTTLARAL
jgi:fluoride exporter